MAEKRDCETVSHMCSKPKFECSTILKLGVFDMHVITHYNSRPLFVNR